MALFNSVEGATPIEDSSGLIPTHITTKEQLNEWEANNILKAQDKYLTKRKTKIFTVELIKNVHLDMFDETWDWAGKFRNSNLNIGADWHQIREEVNKLVGDIEYWKKGESKLSVLEQSVRVHHRLVKIHSFKNGNGRHARLISDIFLFSYGHQLPTWPSHKIISSTKIRKQYIEKLKEADRGNYRPLEKFTRSLMKK